MLWAGKNNPKFKHGMTGTKVYRAWKAMKVRCYNSNIKGYENYGGRGISICNKWMEDFEAFYKDMGDPPTKSHSLERKNNDGNYCKENCRWATRSEQNLNKRQQRFSNKFGYRGVDASRNSFVARVGRKYIGCFDTPEEAALAYNKEALEKYGRNAILNVIKEEKC